MNISLSIIVAVIIIFVALIVGIFSMLSYALNIRQRLRTMEDTWNSELKTLELKFCEEKRLAVEQAKKRSRTSQRNQIKGQMGERFTPFMDGFNYKPSDCRFLGEPIDFIIFNNLHECSDGLVPVEAVELIIVDVKTGNARLSKRQKILKQAISNNQVRFETLRIAESHNKHEDSNRDATAKVRIETE